MFLRLANSFTVFGGKVIRLRASIGWVAPELRPVAQGGGELQLAVGHEDDVGGGAWPWSGYRAHVGQVLTPPWLDRAGLHGYLLGLVVNDLRMQAASPLSVPTARPKLPERKECRQNTVQGEKARHIKGEARLHKQRHPTDVTVR